MMCPVCTRLVAPSAHLHTVFADDPYGEWFANLVTHFRHNHLTSWNKAWRNAAYRRKAIRKPYEEAKAEVNNRAKRQLMRAVMKSRWPAEDRRGLISAVSRLQSNEPATLSLMHKFLARLGGGIGGEGAQIGGASSSAPPTPKSSSSSPPESAAPRRIRRLLEDWVE